RSLGLSICQAACDQLLLRLLKDAAQELERGSPAPDADGSRTALFDSWLRAGALQLEALAQGPAADEMFQHLKRLRDALATRLDTALKQRLLEASLQQHLANELIDLSEAVLTSAEDLKPRTAAAQMELFAEDIEWFLAHVETQPTSRRRLRRKRRRLRS